MFPRTFFVASYFVRSWYPPQLPPAAPPPPPPPPPGGEEGGWVRVEEPTGLWVRVG